MTYDGSSFYVSGQSGEIIKSTDGESWDSPRAAIPTLAEVNALKYLSGKFVVVGRDSGSLGKVSTSSDNVTWTTSTFGVNQSVYGAAFGNSVFVVVGGNGLTATSTDGLTWTTRTNGTASWLDVAFGSGLFVAVGSSGSIATSPDGITWTAQTSGQANGINAVTYGAGKFVAVGTFAMILTSTDGITWTLRTSGTDHYVPEVVFNGTDFLITGNRFLSSSDGETWSIVATNLVSPNTIRQVEYGGGKYVGVSTNGSVAVALPPAPAPTPAPTPGPTPAPTPSVPSPTPSPNSSRSYGLSLILESTLWQNPIY